MSSKEEITGYRFLDKDPIIDVYREAKRKSGIDEEAIYASGGPTPHTLREWDLGKTRKPQRLSIAYAMLAMGYHEQYFNPETRDTISTHFKSLPGLMRVDNNVVSLTKRARRA